MDLTGMGSAFLGLSDATDRVTYVMRDMLPTLYKWASETETNKQRRRRMRYYVREQIRAAKRERRERRRRRA